ncbi:MAG: ATP-dependent DNA ligase [Candidatus Aenigmarchaeota archaeon]|nr:ATP-dependent DNA ligase [Candidatus Aenigmarchaeota archaeon]
MLYKNLVELYESLESEPSRLTKVRLISNFLRKSETDELAMITLMVSGKIFPSYSDEEIGIAEKTAVKIISISTGFPEGDVSSNFNETGDLGQTCENLMSKRKQLTLGKKSLSAENVFDNFRKLATVEGKGSQDVKMNLIKELITHASPKESKYIIRTSVNELRIGVAEGVLRDAIAEAFLDTETMEKKKESVSAVEWAWFLNPDYGSIAMIAKKRGIEGLRKVRVEIGKPYHVLLSEKSPGLKEAMELYEKIALEFKYDGARIVIHKKGDKLWFYTRRLENVTRQFPELREFVMNGVDADECIIEGEMLGFDKRTGKPMPFQFLSQRIKRKYEIERMVSEIPIQVKIFDIIYLDGKELFDKKLSERWSILKKIINTSKGFQLAEHIETKEMKKAEEFYRKALEAGQEGLIVKNLDAYYHPGRRVAGGWLKVKPIMETLDLVITGATWGTGKRATWMGSFVLSCRDGDKYLECGMMGTGIKEKITNEGDITFEHLTKILKPYMEKEDGNEVKIKPMIVVEIAYEEIQKSPNYSSGYALRFPRLVRLRDLDKKPEDSDDIERIKKLYEMQKGRSKPG